MKTENSSRESAVERNSNLIRFQKGVGITGCQLNLRYAHMLQFKELYSMTEDYLGSQNGEMALVVLELIKPFLNLFKDVEHPHDNDLWTVEIQNNA